MTPERLELLSALIDGEAVDSVLLAEALADAQAPELLLDFVLLRAGLAETAATSSAQRMRRAPWRRATGWVAAAAAAAVICAFGLWSLRSPKAEGPPRATRVLQFENWHEPRGER